MIIRLDIKDCDFYVHSTTEAMDSLELRTDLPKGTRATEELTWDLPAGGQVPLLPHSTTTSF
jgi:hypothetical protein